MPAPSTKYAVDGTVPLTPRQRKIRDISRSIWNPDTRQFCSRTGASWAKISIFYLIFYTFLATMFACMFLVMLNNLDDAIPRLYYEHQSQMLFTPEYQGDKTHTLRDCDNTTDLGSCTIPAGSLGKCDGSDPYFGYDKGAPCVFLKFNKIIGWTPESFDVNPNFDVLGGRWSTDNIAMSCEGASDTDKALLGPVEYFPEHGLPFSCFPYCGKKVSANYILPPQMVKFTSPARDKIIVVWCRAWSRNIWTDDALEKIKTRAGAFRRDHYGSTYFELIIDS